MKFSFNKVLAAMGHTRSMEKTHVDNHTDDIIQCMKECQTHYTVLIYIEEELREPDHAMDTQKSYHPRYSIKDQVAHAYPFL